MEGGGGVFDALEFLHAYSLHFAHCARDFNYVSTEQKQKQETRNSLKS